MQVPLGHFQRAVAENQPQALQVSAGAQVHRREGVPENMRRRVDADRL